MKEEEDSMWGSWFCMWGCKEMDVWAQVTVKCLWNIDLQSIINHRLYGHLPTCWLLEQLDYRLQFGDSTFWILYLPGLPGLQTRQWPCSFFFKNHKDDQIMINFQNDCESYLNFKSKIFLVIVKQKRGFLVISQFVGHWISFT